jgi:hypothetical protein
LFANSVKPIFVGKCHVSQGRVVVEGRFTMFRFAKVFMTVWANQSGNIAPTKRP